MSETIEALKKKVLKINTAQQDAFQSSIVYNTKIKELENELEEKNHYIENINLAIHNFKDKILTLLDQPRVNAMMVKNEILNHERRIAKIQCGRIEEESELKEYGEEILNNENINLKYDINSVLNEQKELYEYIKDVKESCGFKTARLNEDSMNTLNTLKIEILQLAVYFYNEMNNRINNNNLQYLSDIKNYNGETSAEKFKLLLSQGCTKFDNLLNYSDKLFSPESDLNINKETKKLLNEAKIELEKSLENSNTIIKSLKNEIKNKHEEFKKDKREFDLKVRNMRKSIKNDIEEVNRLKHKVLLTQSKLDG